MQIETENKLLSVKEVRAILGFDSNNKIYDYIRKKQLPAFRIGSHGKKDKYNRHHWRIRESDLAEFIKAGGNNSSKDRE